MPLVMGAPWQGGYFGSLDFGITAAANLRNTILMFAIPNLSLSIGETEDMSKYFSDPLGLVTDSRIVNLSLAIATYSHATKLMTAVTNGTTSGLQLEVTF